jgi:hypothetical protein
MNIIREFNDIENIFNDLTLSLHYNKQLFYHEMSLINIIKTFKNNISVGLKDSKFFFDVLIESQIFIVTNQSNSNHNTIYKLDDEINTNNISLNLIKKSLNTGVPYKKLTRKEKLKKIFEDEI